MEYRVWCHPERGACDLYQGADYFQAFPNYEQALEYANSHHVTEQPIVLIRQLEWIDEPDKGALFHHKGVRLAEWLPEWLQRGKRQIGQIEEFIKTRS